MKRIICLVCAAMLALLTACQKSAEPVALLLPDPVVIAVAPFNQPTNENQLLAGYIPDGQGVADPATMQGLDAVYKRLLQKKSRQYVFLQASAVDIPVQKDSQGRHNVLATWTELARKAGADFIIVPQLLHWEERVGDASDVLRPASVTMDFYLIDARPAPEHPDGMLQARSHYSEAPQLPVFGGFGPISPRFRDKATDFAKEAMFASINKFSL